MGTRYRIYTENVEGTIHMVKEAFEGATIFSATGLWKGAFESSLVVEVIDSSESNTLTAHDFAQKVYAFRRILMLENSQEYVLITREDVTIL